MTTGKTCTWLMVLTCFAASPAAWSQTTFKIATIVPEGSSWVVAMRSSAADIEQRTDGRVKFKLYTGGVQGNNNQVLRKMRIGQLHGGAFTSGSLRQFHPSSELYSLPMVFKTQEEVRYVRERMDERLRHNMEQAGYVNFGFAGGGFAYLMGRHRIANFEDTKGSKIWIPEGDQVASGAARALGISPVTLPLTDVLTGLQTDLIDTVMGPPVGAIVMQWNTVAKYITDVPIAYIYAMLVIDKKAFSKLTEADQAIVREVMDAVYRKFDQESETQNQASMQALLTDGLQLVQVEESEVNDWRRKVHASNRELAAAGVFNAALLDEVECYLAAFRDGTDDSHCLP